MRNRKFYLVPGVSNRKFYLVPNDSYETFYLAVKGLKATDLAPFFMNMVNKSFCSGEVLMALKKSIVTPILKKPNLDADDLANYRPVSNLPFISKLLEKIVAKRLSALLDYNKLLPHHQSAYRRFHFMETALLCVLSDLTSTMESEKLVSLTLLDMSVAFDTVDHEIVLRLPMQRTAFGTVHSCGLHHTSRTVQKKTM